MKKTILLITAMASFTANANQSLGDDAILVDDIGYKLAAGFKADDVVYRLPKSNFKSEAESLQGIGSPEFQSYMGTEARGRYSTFAYSSQSGSGDIYRTGGDTFTDIMLEMPDGNEFEFVRIWGYDSDAVEDLHFFAFELCLPTFAGGPVTSTILDDVDFAFSTGDFSALAVIPAATMIDNTGCTYMLRTRFDTTGNTLRLFKVRAQSVSAP